MSAAFKCLHHSVQQWVYDQGWTNLRRIQEEAIGAILDGSDVIVSAPTAGGKTEAAMLPICSALASDTFPPAGDFFAAEALNERGRGFDVLCISPLKALIDDQWRRLEQLCAFIDVPLHRWHRDVAASVKQRSRRNPSGVLLVTPESLEATFVNRGHQILELFGNLRNVVIDEVHTFIGTPRGAQLQSLLHRLEVVTGRTAARIALSATISDHDLAARFLRPADPAAVRVIAAPSGETQLKLEVRGYRTRPTSDDDEGGAEHAIATDLYGALRGGKHLVFANSRRDVETYSGAAPTWTLRWRGSARHSGRSTSAPRRSTSPQQQLPMSLPRPA